MTQRGRKGGKEGRPLCHVVFARKMKNQLWIEEGAATPPPTDGDGRRWRRGEWNKLSFRRDRRPPCLHVLSDPHPIYPTTFTRSYFNPVRGRPPCSSSSSTSSPSLHSNPTPLSLSPIINPWLHSLTRQTCPPPQKKSLLLPPRTTAAVESALRQASQSQSGPVFGSGSNLNSHNH